MESNKKTPAKKESKIPILLRLPRNIFILSTEQAEFLGLSSRSSFIRLAIVEKLKKLGAYHA